MRHQTAPVSHSQKRCMTLRLCTLQDRMRLTALTLFFRLMGHHPIGRFPAPVGRQNTFSNKTMERRMRPVGDSRHQAMLHRIDMDVIDVIVEVAFVSDQMLPVAALPDAAFRFPDTRNRYMFSGRHKPGKFLFDQHPACREITIIPRQRPDSMQMFWQDHPCNGLERMIAAHLMHTCTQRIDPLEKQKPGTIRKIHGEEIRAARHPHSSIVRHAARVPATYRQRHRTTPHPTVRIPRSRQVDQQTPTPTQSDHQTSNVGWR